MKNRHDVSMEGCVAKGLNSTGVRDAGELSSPASAQACQMWQLRQPMARWCGCRFRGLPCITKQELAALGWHRTGGRKCLLNECLGGGERRGWRYLPRGLSTPGICIQILDGISSGFYSWALGQPAPLAGLGRKDAASVLESGGFATISSSLEVQGWLANCLSPLSPHSEVPLLIPSSLHCMLTSFY